MFLPKQVYVDPDTYRRAQDIWSGWMGFVNDPDALAKLESVRNAKMSTKSVKDVLSRYLKSCPKEHQRTITDWIKRGSLKKLRGGYFCNITLSCFNPLKRENLAKYDDISPKLSEENDWIKSVNPNDDMIYAPHGIDMIFQDWDFTVISNVHKKEGNLLDAYLTYLTKLFEVVCRKLKTYGYIHMHFIHSNVRDLRSGHIPFDGYFDRISTGIYSDLLGTPCILEKFGGYLNKENPYARLVTHHRVWSLFLEWKGDMQAREM